MMVKLFGRNPSWQPSSVVLSSMREIPMALQAASCDYNASQNREYCGGDFCMFALAALVRISPESRRNFVTACVNPPVISS